MLAIGHPGHLMLGRPRPSVARSMASESFSQRRPGASVVAQGIGHTFDGAIGPVEALRDLHLTVEPGEFCVIVGPSGCGKTTFLRLIAGLDRPTTGTVRVQRTDGSAASNAMVFQGRSVFPWSTVRDNVAYGLRAQGVPAAHRMRVADDLLERVGLARFAKAYPHQLSEGMRQRVAIARALAVDPDLLLMDEPFASLDEQTRFVLQEELLSIWEHTGKTVLFITHSIDEAILLGDRIVVFGANPGRIEADLGVPFSRPRTLAGVRSHPASGPLFDRVWTILQGAARPPHERLVAVQR
ncbi:MAG: ABC transporter, ATP-binding protein (cluster 10, nitrate/sulfonate/bicarbonate) [uncultured Thermomicrobiales bacterium]|uniref:ABC transporter, ATP-binding protein (Cluster 10, nitrate/sulfonate/bicarbonate) n=1 Tax=uncultured Thermomicrobiales bacterium TaxID=1645740 RepID=A0A6J4VJT6_9BACT|nr:MAG: ABC transporter, ATP-binding protein (cluster 10, nitrate/sulfonate/bicarbonate) [uncultured Thermomicrobiales bacterium]